MKLFSKFSISFLILLGFAFTLSAQDAWNHKDYLKNGWKRYQEEKAIIKYEYKGSISGTETIYFDSWGWREGKFSDKTISMFGMQTKENKMDVVDGEIQTGIDLNTNTGTRAINTYMAGLREGNSSKDLTDIGVEMLEAMGGKKTGTQTWLGRTCDVYEIESMQTTTLVWQGISMRTETNMMGMNIIIEATSIDLGATIPESKVTVPESAKIKDLGEINIGGY